MLSGDGEDHRTMEFGDFWSYDPDIGVWEQQLPHPGLSRWAPASFILKGYVYVINGKSLTDPVEDIWEFQKEVYKYWLGEEEVISSIPIEEALQQIQIAANPFSDQLSINLSALQNKNTNLEATIYDINGKVIYKKKLKLFNQIIFPIQTTGGYYLEIIDHKSLKKVGRLLIKE